MGLPIPSGANSVICCFSALRRIQDERQDWNTAHAVADKSEEEDEQGVIAMSEKERFSSEVTVVSNTGQVAVLK